MDQLTKQNLDKNKQGFSTLELLIAMAVLMIVLSAIILVTFGNQSLITDSETNKEALNKAQDMLEHEQALARKDFKLANPALSITDGIYQKSVSISNVDYFTKRITSSVAWTGDRNRPEHTDLTTLVTNFDNPIGGDTCYSNIDTAKEDWTHPVIESAIDFSLISPSGRYTLSDVNAYKGKLYVTASKSINLANPLDTTLPNFFVFDISDTKNPTLLGKSDNASSVTAGLNAVSIAEDQTTGRTYAYAASNTGSDYSSCEPVDPVTSVVDPACGELYIFDVTNPSPVRVGNLKIITTPSLTGQVMGTSIFYKQGYIFLGLTANGSGPEFLIIDMHNPSFVSSGSYPSVGSVKIGHDVNALASLNSYVYAAIPHDSSASELRIFDVSDPGNPVAAGNYNMSGGGNGKSLYIVGDRVYFGNTVPNAGNDFHVLDNTDPTTTLPEIGGVSLASSLNSIIVRSPFAFLLSNTDLQVFNIGNPESTSPFAMGPAAGVLTLPTSGSSTEPTMDCEGDRLFISVNDASGQGSVYTIKPGP